MTARIITGSAKVTVIALATTLASLPPRLPGRLGWLMAVAPTSLVSEA